MSPQTLPTSASHFVDATPLLDDGAALRAQAERDGYLFFKGLLPAQDILRVRADILAVIERYGWRQPGQDEQGALIDVEALNRVPASEMRLDIGVSNDAYNEVQKLESMHALPHHPHLLALYKTLFERHVLVHPRHIVRLVTPHHAMVPTPQHQDFPLIQGTSNTWTCWFPLGPCPRTMGGLTVLKSSHRLGNLPIQETEGAGGIAAQLCPWENQWVEADYELGDVLTFPSFTVHKALPCQVKDQIRISLDVRYQASDEPIEEKSLQPHCPLTWEEIYAGWQSEDLQYYWRDLPLGFSDWDHTLRQPKRRIC